MCVKNAIRINNYYSTGKRSVNSSYGMVIVSLQSSAWIWLTAAAGAAACIDCRGYAGARGRNFAMVVVALLCRNTGTHRSIGR